MNYWKMVCLGCTLFAAMTVPSSAQFKKLVDLNGPNGAYPGYVGLVQGTDGNFYGTTEGGGANGYGSVFRMTPGGTVTTLHSFGNPNINSADGAVPYAGLLLGRDGAFYGTTIEGGTSRACQNGCGTVFKITQSGVLTTLHTFDSTDGANPVSELIEGTDGNLYGTTQYGGANMQYSCTIHGGLGCGTIFKIRTTGEFKALHSFNGNDGFLVEAALVQGADGDLYGSTGFGGTADAGTIFRVTLQGELTTLYNFLCQSGCPDGDQPHAALIQGDDGDFYGTTEDGGTCALLAEGTVFKITPTGALTSLHTFCGADGTFPVASLIRATDGNLYGTTSTGGGSSNCPSYDGCGTAFKLVPGGALTTLHVFHSADGLDIYGGLFQSTDGRFYGTTNSGGIDLEGIVYRLDGGLAPFIAFVQPTAKVGKTAQILGQGLTGTTSVTFNGVAATKFNVVSDTYMTAVVPAGATTGAVVVATPAGNLTSNVSFRVTR